MNEPPTRSEITQAFQSAFSLLADRLLYVASLKIEQWVVTRLDKNEDNALS